MSCNKRIWDLPRPSEGVDARVRHRVVKLPAGDSLIVSALCRSKERNSNHRRRCVSSALGPKYPAMGPK